MSRPTITLTTDFGLRDAYVGVMKGVIARIAPDANVIDLTHHVGPQNILHGALVLEAAAGQFPKGTIHVAVVDPGVGSERKPLAAQIGDDIYIVPDNGLLTFVLAKHPLREAVVLDNARYHNDEVSSTFHGRDIFAPCAAHLAAGAALDDLGSAVGELVTLDVPNPEQISTNELRANVLYIDHFGNAVTNLTRDRFGSFIGSREPCSASLAYDQGGRLHRIALCSTFADVEPGEPVAYFGSTHRLEIAVRNGSAADVLGMQPGAAINVNMNPR